MEFGLKIIFLIFLSSSAFSYDRVDEPKCNDGENPSSSPVQCTKKSSGKFTIQGYKDATSGCKVSFTCIFDPATSVYSACPTGRGIWSSIDHECWEPSDGDPVVDAYYPYTESQHVCDQLVLGGYGGRIGRLADYFQNQLKTYCSGQAAKVFNGVGVCCTKTSTGTSCAPTQKGERVNCKIDLKVLQEEL